MKTLQWIYFTLRLQFIYIKLNLYYFLYNLNDKLHENVIDDMDSLTDYGNKLLGG
jgi:hypothetical protein